MEQELRELANHYKTNIPTLRRLINDYQIDCVGLEAVLEARESFVFGIQMGSKDRKFYPIGLTFSLNRLCEAYMSLGKNPDIFDDFINKFDEYTPQLAGKLKKGVRARSLPDSLLSLGLKIYKENPERFEDL